MLNYIETERTMMSRGLCCRRPWQEEEGGVAVTPFALLEAESAAGTHLAWCPIHQETTYIGCNSAS
jgi:hypothetical protein